MGKHTFRASISCVAFAPNGEAICPSFSLQGTDAGWHNSTVSPSTYESRDADRIHKYLPIELSGRLYPLHLVYFHLCGNMLVTGEKK